jgi:hypothetical protein
VASGRATEFDSRRGHRLIFFPSRPTRLWGQPNLNLNGSRGYIPELKQPERKAGHLLLLSAGIKDSWFYTSTSSHVLLAWCLKITMTSPSFVIIRQRFRRQDARQLIRDHCAPYYATRVYQSSSTPCLHHLRSSKLYFLLFRSFLRVYLFSMPLFYFNRFSSLRLLLSFRFLSFILTGNRVSGQPQSLNLTRKKKTRGTIYIYIYIKKISNVSGNLKTAEQQPTASLLEGFHTCSHMRRKQNEKNTQRSELLKFFFFFLLLSRESIFLSRISEFCLLTNRKRNLPQTHI